MFGHDDHDDEQKDDAVTVEPVVSTTPDDTTPSAPQTDDPTVADITEAPAAEETTSPTEAPEVTPPTPPASEPTEEPASSADPALLELKKQALEELSPLVEHLDQTPEEKFKTTMMLIQATDSSNLISTAHEAAKGITDEKVRAQALLDIVNEINYFTQK